MESKFVKEKLEENLKLLQAIKDRVADERTALTLLQEVNKDARMALIREEREGSVFTVPATQPQINLLRKLGGKVAEGITKEEASGQIDELLAKKESW